MLNFVLLELQLLMIHNLFPTGTENLTDLSGTPKKAPSVPSDLSKIVSGTGLSTPKGRGSISKLPGPKSGRDSSSRESTPSDENLAGSHRGKAKAEEKKVLKKYLWEKSGRVKVRL